MNLKLIIHPNDILRTQCTDLIEKPSKELINGMWELVRSRNGVGLAAPQIGESLNMFLVNNKNDKLVFINPKITYYSKIMCSFEEGCLSIPGQLITIVRPELVRVEFLDKNFKKQEKLFGGLTARIIQHEYDHLIGKLIIDYQI